MRQINSKIIQDKVYDLTVEANIKLRQDVKELLEKSLEKEDSVLSKKMIKAIIDNYKIAEKRKIPICQDTGMVVVFLEVGSKLKLDFTELKDAINSGVGKAYKENFFRKSVVAHPLSRQNTNDNLPAIIHYDFVEGESLKISVLIKGFGSENKSSLNMFNPTATEDEIINYIVDVVRKASADGCPPYVLGIGIGGTMDKAALMSKKALLEDIDKIYEDADIASLRKKIIERINNLEIGVMGLNGNVTCLGVNILTYPTHIAGLPVAVNVNCHALRSAKTVI